MPQVFTPSGIVVHTPDLEHPGYDSHEPQEYQEDNFAGRQPIIWNAEGRQLYVGAPNWYHHDVEVHHDISDPSRRTPRRDGFFGGATDEWGGGNLAWYGSKPEGHDEVAKALSEAGYYVPQTEQAPKRELSQEDWEDDDISGFHHPRPEIDEWR